MNTKNYFSLSHKVAFYTPSTEAKSKPISGAEFDKRTQAMADQLTEWFGGATVERVNGFFKSDNGQYITEPIHKIVSFCSSEALEQHASELLNLAHDHVTSWQQESIGVEIDSKFYLVD